MTLITRVIVVSLLAKCLFLSIYANAQKLEPLYDTAYIESFRDYMIISLVTVRNSNDITIKDNSGDEIVFSTNTPFYFGFAMDYKWFTLEYTTSFNKYGNIKYGKTNSQSIGFGLTGRKFWFRNFWKKYDGYYMSNPEYYDPDFNPQTDEYILRPDLHNRIYFANLNYGFNYLKFSNMASLWQLEKQKKSAGSFTLGLSFAYNEYSSDSALIIPEWEDNFNNDALIAKFNLMLIGINGGYLHTFSLFKRRRLFISLALIPGLSFQTGKTFHENGTNLHRKNMIGLQNEARFVLGYNHERWYTSLSTIGYFIANNFAKDNSINQDYTFFRFMIGYKFKLPEIKSSFLKKLGLGNERVRFIFDRQ